MQDSEVEFVLSRLTEFGYKYCRDQSDVPVLKEHLDKNPLSTYLDTEDEDDPTKNGNTIFVWWCAIDAPTQTIMHMDIRMAYAIIETHLQADKYDLEVSDSMLDVDLIQASLK